MCPIRRNALENDNFACSSILKELKKYRYFFSGTTERIKFISGNQHDSHGP